jgi:putative sterol carrier protein
MSDPILFATEAWVKRLAEAVNSSESYRKAASHWEGDFYFIVEPDGVVTEPIYMYMDLYHGECRQAFLPEDPAAIEPEFQVRGKLRVWRAVTRKELDPIKALITRQLLLSGNMAKIMRNVRAANELVNCTTKFQTRFPAD